LKEVIGLDSAVSSRFGRQYLLQRLGELRSKEIDEMTHCKKSLEWMMLRGIKLRKIVKLADAAEDEDGMINVMWMTNSLLMRLANACGPSLQSIDLRKCRELTDVGAIGLAEKCPGLKKIHLAGTDGAELNISDASVVSLANNCSVL